MGIHRPYTKGEEVFNSISHGVGSLLAVIGTAVMVTLAVVHSRGPLAVIGALVYGLTLVAMFTMSTLYHAIPFPRAKRVLQILDHDSIYLLIAGTYTPITLVTLWESRGLLILVAVWTAVILGIVLNAINLQRFKTASLLLYVVMGWAVLWDMRAVIQGLGTGGFALLLAGGVCYTVGILFYKMKSIHFMHGIWHLFVVGGAVLHYFCVLLYVL